MRIVIDADDAAFNLKKELVAHLQSKGIEVEDLDYNGTKPDATYPEVGYNLALKVQAEKLDRGHPYLWNRPGNGHDCQ